MPWEPNVFIADRDLRLVYMNQRAETTMKGISSTLEEAFGLSYRELLGSNIDRFHGDRIKQIRRLLSDPGNLPHRKEIKIGGLILDLNINAILDEQGQYIGTVVNWEDITETKLTAADTGDRSRPSARRRR